ncbi:MAG: hypothetical protein AB2733_20205 [Candidatus Thiodiazotropha taylori]|nr:hypothetical protein [Candidatus Thiodiazotropha taylori]RLW71672.1 MAG: hypothetical protein B6D71_00915 [gamma proteobacterium symbiont of Stewartia floridana]
MNGINKSVLLLILMLLPGLNLIAEGNTENPSSLMPKYGNWCGLNHPTNPKTAEPPIDILDAICRQHDICYLIRGHMDCECDSEFNRAVVANKERFSATERFVAGTFRIYFRGSPCYGDQREKVPATRVITGIVEKADTRTKQVIQRFKAVTE